MAQLPAWLPTNALAAWYPLNGSANDFSGNGNHGTAYNTASAASHLGVPGAAYRFNGTNSYIHIPPSASLNINGSVSISVWVRAASTAPASSQQIFWRGDLVAAYDPYTLSTLNGFYCYRRDGLTIDTLLWPLTNTVFHHIVGIYDSSANTYKMYVDGVLRNTKSHYNPVQYPTATFWNMIGAVDNGNWQNFAGDLDELAVYARPITECEIQQLYTHQLQGPAIATQPANANSTIGQSVTFQVVSPLAGVAYQWQKATGSGPFTNIANTPPYSGANTPALTINPVSATQLGERYRCVLTSSLACPSITNTVAILPLPGGCGAVANLPDTVRKCSLGTVALQPTLTPGAYVPFDTFWMPAAGLSNPNIINPTVLPNAAAGYYYLHVLADAGNNLVANGDFSNGNTGFTSDYIYATNGGPTGMLPDGYYGVTNNPANLHSLWPPMGDHTTGNGQMMCVNGSQTPNTNVWCQTVSVQPNTTYNFSAFVATITSQNPAILQFNINGTLLAAPFTAPATQGVWVPFNTTWSSGSATTATICITNQNTVPIGNDFALDDISLRKVCEIVDSFYLLPVAGLSATQNLKLCNGTSYTFGGNTLSAAGTYIHTFATTAGCDSTVTLHLAYVSSFDTTLQVGLCPGKSYSFAGNNLTTAGTYKHTFKSAGGCDSNVTLVLSFWNIGSDTTRIAACQDTIFYFGGTLVNAPGTYSGKFTSQQGCDSMGTLVFERVQPPFVGFSSTPAGTALNIPFAFANLSQRAVRYLWSFGDGETSSEAEPVHQYLRSGTYHVCLTGWSSEGCREVSCQEVTAEVRLNIEVPTAFSPNGDGRNDVLYARGGGVKSFTLAIYNRWGQKVFETNDLKKGWDGAFNGTPMSNEAVAYMLNATFIDGSQISRQGNITVLP